MRFYILSLSVCFFTSLGHVYCVDVVEMFYYSWACWPFFSWVRLHFACRPFLFLKDPPLSRFFTHWKYSGEDKWTNKRYVGVKWNQKCVSMGLKAKFNFKYSAHFYPNLFILFYFFFKWENPVRLACDIPQTNTSTNKWNNPFFFYYVEKENCLPVFLI